MNLVKVLSIGIFLVGSKAQAASILAECFAGNKNNPHVCITGAVTQAQFETAWKEALDSKRVSADKKPDFASIQSGYTTNKSDQQSALDKAWQDAGHPGEKAPSNFAIGKPIVIPEPKAVAVTGVRANDDNAAKINEPSAADKASHNEVENAYYKVYGKYPDKVTASAGDQVDLDKVAADLKARCEKFEGKLSAQHSKIQNACGDAKKPANAACFNRIKDQKVSGKSATQKSISDHNSDLAKNVDAALGEKSIFGKLSADDYKNVSYDVSELGSDHKHLFALLQKLRNLETNKNIKKMIEACKADKCKVETYNSQLRYLKSEILAEKERSKFSKRAFFLTEKQEDTLFPKKGYLLEFADVQKVANADADNLDIFVSNIKQWKMLDTGKTTSHSDFGVNRKNCCPENHSSFWCTGDGKAVAEAALTSKAKEAVIPAPVVGKGAK